MLRRKILLMAALMVLSLAPLAYCAQEVIPGYHYRAFSLDEIKAFSQVVAAERTAYEKSLQAKYPDKPEKVAKNASMQAYNSLQKDTESLLKVVEAGKGGSAAEGAFIKLQRLHYGILADISIAKKGNIGSGIKMLVNVAFGPVSLNVPDVIDPESPIGERNAKKEAARLYNSKGMVPPEQLAKMSPLEISRLQPSPTHNAFTGLPVGNQFGPFLKEATRLIRLQPKLEKFDMTYARRVLFFDELKDEATSPKITTKDRYGLKWKVKWGDEVHTDVALTRIYMDLGGKFTDFKFYSGPAETIVVLSPADEKNPQAIKTFADLSKALLQSKFKFHADRYLMTSPVLKDKAGNLLGTGQVDAAMAERESIPAKYIGAYYTTFKECQVSLYNPIIQRLGGAALSNVGAPEDRVARSSMVFNAWIKNKDMKDDNSRVGLVFNPLNGKFDKMVEYQSDLGCAMGSLVPSGELNSFEKSFVMFMPQSINFVMRPLYIPKAWKDCTWSDARWMAMRIASFKREDLERSFAECGWPAFAQQIAVEKLLSRRNELIKAFHLDVDGFKEIPCSPDLTIKAQSKNGPDTPLSNGKINDDSSIVRELVASQHPEGLGKIVPRKKD